MIPKNSINIVLFILLAAMLLNILACNKSEPGDCLRGRGETTTESRGLLTFGNISVNDNISLKIIQGTAHKVDIRTGENIISSITTLIDNNTLYIRNESGCTILTDPWNKVEVELTVPDFDTLFISTAGIVAVADTMHMDSTWIRIDDSSGDVDLTFDIDKLFLHYQKGTSDVRIYGTGSDGIFYTAAYGLLDTREFRPKHVTINNGSINDCYVHSGINSLDAKVTNIGNIYYLDEPQSLIEVIEGSGKVIKLE